MTQSCVDVSSVVDQMTAMIVRMKFGTIAHSIAQLQHCNNLTKIEARVNLPTTM